MLTELNKHILEQASKFDTFYLYNEKQILESIDRIKQNFPDIDFLYSIKCNSNPHVLSTVFSHGLEADAASKGEVLISCEVGLPKEKIYYSAPGKTISDIEQTITKSILIADSIDEILRIESIAKRMNIQVSIGIRLNPNFTFYSDRGNLSKFGIDEDQAIAFIKNTTLQNTKINGIHVHLKSQELNPHVLSKYYTRMLLLAEEWESLTGGLSFLNLGSGFGVPQRSNDTSLDLSILSSEINPQFKKFKEKHPNTRIIIETGRYVVCKSGYYIMKVLDRKVSMGKIFIIIKNTLNGFIRPSIAELIKKYASEDDPAGTEPLFTASNAFQFFTLKDDKPSETVSLVGNLCTAADVVAEDILMPHLEYGDVIGITNAGAYAAVLSPMQFSSQEKPVELFLTSDGCIKQ
ncbi:diaminopimelate decarboxylase [Histomonas meleagridis]|uniref:diaminopimelate decarboxylase n=1 Tax=Histomonas meleagridis TaxID=135588 RepID=UPI003559567E|nr:diaminopimelate decarboxylase [Histomonas meleagridis]KAH0800206.1 diaminopimelate decarboxylase [Histomonas meleagridis]